MTSSDDRVRQSRHDGPSTITRSQAELWLRPLVWVVVVMSAYMGLAFLIPFNNDLPIVDEPIFAASAFHFAATGEIMLNDLSAPTAVFDIWWGGSFTRLFGTSYGSLRLSTLVLMTMSAPFMYLLCRNFGARPAASVIGVAAYLFNPLTFSLAFSFQTDAHALALMVASSALLTAGLTGRRGQLRFLGGGSALSALAFLSRQQALVIVIAALITWLIWGPSDSRRFVGASVIILPPAIVYWLHARWVASVGEPMIRSLSQQELMDHTLADLLTRSGPALIQASVFMGLFVVALLPLLLPSRDRWRWIFARPLMIGVGAGLIVFWIFIAIDGWSLLAVETWATTSGLGAVDRSHLGQRPPLLGDSAMAVLLLAFFAGTFFLIPSAIKADSLQGSPGIKPFAAIAFGGSIVAAYVSSLAFHGRILDRYWLPILPFVVGLAVSTGRSVRLRLVAASMLILAMGAVAATGTRDAFVAYATVVDFADGVTQAEINPLELDAGATWTAHRFGLAEFGGPGRDWYSAKAPWWVVFYGDELRPSYAIALEALDGYEVLERREYSSWLHLQPTYLYLLYRDPDLGFYLRMADV